MKVLLSNPHATYVAQADAINNAIKKVLDGAWYINGPEVTAFEEDFAKYTGTKFGVGVANGTDAIELALRSLELTANDAVFTVAHTAVATVSAIERAGATPVIVDIEPDTYTMCPKSLSEAIASVKSLNLIPKAIVAVHIYGHPADITAIDKLANLHGLTLIEDCAQAHGAKFNSKRVGSHGKLASFSFYPTKNLGAFGDGGMTLTSDDSLHDKLKALREYGWRERYISSIQGVNSRLDELHAAMLRVKLTTLDQDNAKRRDLATLYADGLSNLPLTLPTIRKGCEHVFHLYVVRTPERSKLIEGLKKSNIGFGIHYPMPIHLQPGYRHLNRNLVSLANTEKAAAEILSLPMYPQLSTGEVQYVCQSIKSIF